MPEHTSNRIGRNEFGTPISMHTCRSCGEPFTVCPPRDDEEWGGCCLAETCGSYDLTRDADLLWEHLPIERSSEAA